MNRFRYKNKHNKRPMFEVLRQQEQNGGDTQTGNGEELHKKMPQMEESHHSDASGKEEVLKKKPVKSKQPNQHNKDLIIWTPNNRGQLECPKRKQREHIPTPLRMVAHVKKRTKILDIQEMDGRQSSYV
ncbi:hypothetical protein HAX54_045102 [Datura stramonium]|uniref:Uncharacterized protein n=1 Tax=Datura stramonium TaxID=4076 RepID=A0ABS8SQ91_DATST|nr:hypothetical protein [Datura stramonium]